MKRMSLEDRIKVLATAVGDGECKVVDTREVPPDAARGLPWVASAERGKPESPIDCILAARGSTRDMALENLYRQLVEYHRKQLADLTLRHENLRKDLGTVAMGIESIQELLASIGEGRPRWG